MKCPYCNEEVELMALFSMPPNPRHYFCVNESCEAKGKFLVESKGVKLE